MQATRGSNASKSGVAKVSKQVAMAFMKRTLARCRKFEETGKSCFTEPAIRDVLFAAPPREVDIESTKITGLTSRSMTTKLSTLLLSFNCGVLMFNIYLSIVVC